jgi:hypothetical protein
MTVGGRALPAATLRKCAAKKVADHATPDSSNRRSSYLGQFAWLSHGLQGSRQQGEPPQGEVERTEFQDCEPQRAALQHALMDQGEPQQGEPGSLRRPC